MSVIGLQPGKPLSQWAEESPQGERLAAARLAEAYRMLKAVTSQAARNPKFASLPRRPLIDDLEEVLSRGGEWLELDEFREHVARLTKFVEKGQAPLMLTNGDFAPPISLPTELS